MTRTVRAMDTDRHGEGCDCGVCDQSGKAYGAAIIAYMEFKVKGMNPDEMEDYIREQEPVEVVYASSMESAVEQAWDIVKSEQKSA